MNHKATNIKSQQKKEKKPLDISFFAYKMGSKRHKALVRTLHLILKYNTTFKCMYFSQSHLGDVLGYSRQYINDIIEDLVKYGYIFKYNRQSKTCEYEVNPYILQGSYKERLKIYLNNFFSFLSFSIFLLTPIRATNATSAQYISNDFNLLKRTCTVSQTSTRTSLAIPLYEQVHHWLYQPVVGVPNEKVTYEQFEAFFTERYTTMNDTFTQEQLEILAQYPTASLQYAQKMLTRDMAAGKVISNLFSYFHSIAKRHAEKPPTMGKTSYQGHTVSASQDRQARDSMQDRYRSQIEHVREQKRAKLHEKGIDSTGLSDYQVKLALEGKLYLMDDMLKEIQEGPFKSVAVFQDLFGKKIATLPPEADPDMEEVL